MRPAPAAWLPMAWLGLLCALLLPLAAHAAPVEELQMLAEHPVEGMRGGNLSGLALCGQDLYTESDRDDDQLYRLDISQKVWRAEAQTFKAPPPPPSGLTWGMDVRTWLMSFVRGGDFDFEAISCDAAQNRYLVSEAHAAVLKVTPAGQAEWLPITPRLVREARAAGLLAHFNGIFEGLAVNPAGDQLWLAAERSDRGLLMARRTAQGWDCDGACVLLSEAPHEAPPAAAGKLLPGGDFSDLAYYHGKLFTLERYLYKICRRDAKTAAVEKCWSYARDALVPERRYDKPYGVAEALVIHAEGAWVGNDNNDWARGDGDRRPIVWRYAAPAAGWDAP